ncbi:hypothetical protein SAC12B_0049 [Lactobacillus phage SAC12B]|uniref:Uncharacterized protein n=1 Tax=Lactobacillus phage SAC12B TaxID=2510941 RepID=A0A4Y5FH50_9CAUD|nr:hypothetical protein HWC10_gp049 [Lactobacillus phage SAC12B]QBJ03838.1 hypothetical protein SAC12B_0049 [Lactobacillus phage SAC12B]
MKTAVDIHRINKDVINKEYKSELTPEIRKFIIVLVENFQRNVLKSVRDNPLKYKDEKALRTLETLYFDNGFLLYNIKKDYDDPDIVVDKAITFNPKTMRDTIVNHKSKIKVNTKQLLLDLTYVSNDDMIKFFKEVLKGYNYKVKASYFPGETPCGDCLWIGSSGVSLYVIPKRKLFGRKP